MLRVCLEDGSVPADEPAAKQETDQELQRLNNYLTEGLGDQPMSSFETAIVRTYLMAKLSGQIQNPAVKQG